MDDVYWNEYDKHTEQIENREEVENARREQEQQRIEDEAETHANQLTDEGDPKPSHEVIDPKKFGILENTQEAINAVTGAGVDIYNSVASLPKFLDPNFYKQDNPDNPYKFNAPWLLENKPITRTVWGNFTRQGLELAGGLIGTGKIMWGLKGARTLMTAAKATRVGRVGLSAVQGGAYDLISNQSQEQNLARSLIDIKPQWAGALSPLATNERMSPAMRSMYNVGEGLGLGGFFDIAVEATGWGSRAVSTSLRKKYAENVVNDPLTKGLIESSDFDYAVKTNTVADLTRSAYERSMYRKSKSTVGIDNWRKTNDPWKELPKKDQEALMLKTAEKRGIEWGPERDMDRRALAQGKAKEDLGVQQLEFDIAHRQTRTNPAYYKGGDITDNQALSGGAGIDSPAKSYRDMIEIRNNPEQRYGAPSGVLTEANIRRLEYQAPGTILKERDALAKALEADPSFQVLYKGASREAVTEDLKNASIDLVQFLNDSGHSRLVNIPEDKILKYIKDKGKGAETAIEGIGILNNSQLAATDVILGQMLYEARDLAKAALSVSEHIDAAQPGGLLEGILARYSAVSRLRKETSMLSSFNLRRFNSGLKDNPELQALRGQASDAAANEVATLKQLLESDASEDMLESFLHFTATANGNKQTWKDLQAFFKRQLHGYRDGDTYARNAIINELQVMGINSMLSGPKTPMRALAGTGLGTVMRPVATIIGSAGDYLKGNDEVTRGAFANLAGMVSGVGDSWRKAVADFQSYNLDPEGFRGFNSTKSDQQWSAIKDWAEQYGSDADKAVARTTDWLRGVNRVPLFNYGPRIMKAQDTFFTNMIARGRIKQLSFTDVYTKLKSQNLTVSDEDFADLIKGAEGHFESKVFTGDGAISDDMVKFAADEAKLTKELTGRIKAMERVFDRTPYLKPFFLFARTGVNALEMTSKYTPGLNYFIKEHHDIMTKPWNHPDMVKYGIRSLNDLDIAKNTMKGRMAIGNGVTFSAVWMALNGKITGNGPPDRQLRNSWTQSGWQPRSIKIGDAWVSYESLEPFNMILSFSADVVDGQRVMGEQWAENQFGRLGYLLSANVTNRTFLAGLLQLQDLLYSKGGDAPRVLANFANNQIPLSSFRNEVGKLLSPGMRELESGFWQSVGNRNLWADLLPGTDGLLPYKYDVLNGSKIRSYDPVTRLYNAISPFQVNIGTSATRELLMRSGLNLKQTFNTGPDGTSFKGLTDMKSKFNFLMSQQNIEEKLTELFKNPQIVQSIYNMEADRASGNMYSPTESLHGPFIHQIFANAKQRAWNQLIEEGDLTARQLQEMHKYQELEARYRKQGSLKRADRMKKEIDNLKSMIYK